MCLSDRKIAFRTLLAHYDNSFANDQRHSSGFIQRVVMDEAGSKALKLDPALTSTDLGAVAADLGRAIVNNGRLAKSFVDIELMEGQLVVTFDKDVNVAMASQVCGTVGEVGRLCKPGDNIGESIVSDVLMLAINPTQVRVESAKQRFLHPLDEASVGKIDKVVWAKAEAQTVKTYGDIRDKDPKKFYAITMSIYKTMKHITEARHPKPHETPAALRLRLRTAKSPDDLASVYNDATHPGLYRGCDDYQEVSKIAKTAHETLKSKHAGKWHEDEEGRLRVKGIKEAKAEKDDEEKGEKDDKGEKWSADVDTKWHPPEGTFEKSGKAIAATLLKAGKKHAMQRLNFYKNRAGKNLSDERRAALDAAQEIIHNATVKESLAPPPEKCDITESVKHHAVAKTLKDAGFDGNTLFTSPAEGWAHLYSAMGKHGLTLNTDDVGNSLNSRGDHGSHLLPIHKMNPDGTTTPTGVHLYVARTSGVGDGEGVDSDDRPIKGKHEFIAYTTKKLKEDMDINESGPRQYKTVILNHPLEGVHPAVVHSLLNGAYDPYPSGGGKIGSRKVVHPPGVMRLRINAGKLNDFMDAVKGAPGHSVNVVESAQSETDAKDPIETLYTYAYGVESWNSLDEGARGDLALAHMMRAFALPNVKGARTSTKHASFDEVLARGVAASKAARTAQAHQDAIEEVAFALYANFGDSVQALVQEVCQCPGVKPVLMESVDQQADALQHAARILLMSKGAVPPEVQAAMDAWIAENPE